MGSEAIKYKEFEIWYNRFSRGEFDLDYDIRSEPETRDFCQLPTCVIEKVLEKLCFKEQMTVRKVCRDLKSVVDSMRSSLKSMEMVSYSDYIECRFDDQLVLYSKRKNIRYDVANVIKIIDKDYWKLAIQDWKIAINNPKLRLKLLKIECKEPSGRLKEDTKLERLGEFFTELREALESIRWGIRAEKLQIDTFRPDFNHVEYILSRLQPGYLKSIAIPGFDLKREELNVERPTSPAPGVEPSEAYKIAKSNYRRACLLKDQIYEITELEQWKEAEELHLKYNWDYFDYEDLIHFKRFHFTDCILDRERLIHLREIFSESTNFEFCTITSPNFRIQNCSEYLESFCEKVESGGEVIYHFKNPDDSNKMLEFKVGHDSYALVIEKKNI